MDFWKESSTTVKVLLVVGAVLIIGLAIALIASLSSPGNGETAPPEPTPTFTPAAAQLPAGPMLSATVAATVRLGPGAEYPEIGTLPAGQTVPVIGRSEDGTWYVVNFPNQVNDQGWVAAQDVTTSEIENVPIVAAPALPEPATPTVVVPPQAPIAMIQAANEGQVGAPITFSAEQSTAGTPLVRYAWSFGDGSVADAVIVDKVYDAPGVYLVNLIVVDDAGQESQAQHQITVSAVEATPLPGDGGVIVIPDSLIVVTVDGQTAPVSIVAGIPYFDARVGQVVRMDATPALELYPTLEVVWNMGDGSQPVPGISVEHQYTTSAVYEIAIGAVAGELTATKLWQVGVAE